MRKCRVCGIAATEVVSSYNHTAWMCDSHVETFVLFAIHWRYKDHAPVQYGVIIETPKPVFEKPNITFGEKPIETGEPIEIVPIAKTEKEENPYAYVTHDPEARGFARPRSKHLKISPRWTGMEPKDYQPDGPCVTTKSALPPGIVPIPDLDEKKLNDTDYASKGIIWDSRNVYTKS